MVAGKGLALEDDLVPAVDVGLVKCRHEQVQVRRQRLHDGDLVLTRPNYGRHEASSARIGVEPRRQRRALKRLEVALHALGGPGVEVLVEALGRPFGLEAERVTAEVGAWFRGRVVGGCDC